MSWTVHGVTVELVCGDIVSLQVDAIVNPANSSLILGSGVAGAIKRAGGPAIQRECSAIGHCPLGMASVTTAGDLSARYVIHAVGPRFGIDPEPERYLSSAVFAALLAADEHQCRSVAVPAISSGVFRFPAVEASRIILRTIKDFLNGGTEHLQHVIVCLYSPEMYRVFLDTSQEVF